MISTYDVIKAFKDHEAEGTKLCMKLSEDLLSLVDSETGEFITTVEAFTVELRRQEHCDFESIYYEHVSLDDVYRCRECGTVIFGGDDDYRYDPDCKCPTCCNDPSVCRNEYWTKEEIESDPEKQETIDGLIAMQKEMDEAAERREKRGGLYDWQRWRKRFSIFGRMFKLTLINYNWDKSSKNTDRYLEIHTWKKSDGIVNHHWQLPLSWYHIYIRYIYRYTKKCHPELRRYCWWQKKPKIKGSWFNIGDVIYSNFSNGYFEDPVKMIVTSIEPDEQESSLIHYAAYSKKYNHTLSFNSRDIRENVFLTKKEAKKEKKEKK